MAEVSKETSVEDEWACGAGTDEKHNGKSIFVWDGATFLSKTTLPSSKPKAILFQNWKWMFLAQTQEHLRNLVSTADWKAQLEHKVCTISSHLIIWRKCLSSHQYLSSLHSISYFYIKSSLYCYEVSITASFCVFLHSGYLTFLFVFQRWTESDIHSLGFQ